MADNIKPKPESLQDNTIMTEDELKDMQDNGITPSDPKDKLNQFVRWRIQQYTLNKWKKTLSITFAEDFSQFITKEDFDVLKKTDIIALRDCLRENGVYVKKARLYPVAQALADVVKEDIPWPLDDEDSPQTKQRQPVQQLQQPIQQQAQYYSPQQTIQPQHIVPPENAAHLPSQPPNPPKNIAPILPLYDPNYRIPHQLSSPHKSNLSTIAPIESIALKATLSSTSAIKSLTPHDSGLSPLSTPEKNAFSDTNTAITKAGIKYPTHTTAPITPKATVTLSSTSLPAYCPSLQRRKTTPLPVYRSVSSSSPTYEPYKEPYLTVADLYMRYVPLSKLQTRNKTTRRITTVLPTMSMQDLYEKFHDKEKRVIPTPKSIAQGLTVQQQRHIKSIKHDTLPGICIDDVRRHTMLPVDLAVAVKTPTRFRTLASQQRRMGGKTRYRPMRIRLPLLLKIRLA
ncbi:MAG: hypothetical protein ALECFALPRED_009376 [Alectoria fallacina]|uniref:Uncharacterized protein n=1 Tax=Alectoria fallacina TaxID=1903189 RepID=A0A8H3PJK4_9LECA|nr:MAG: hypothetical protein ALECFALPRED_009376 [Alectoria fallacina]